MKFTKNLVKQKVGTMLITKLKTFVDHIEQLFYSLEELNFSFLVCVCLGQKLENDPQVLHEQNFRFESILLQGTILTTPLPNHAI